MVRGNPMMTSTIFGTIEQTKISPFPKSQRLARKQRLGAESAPTDLKIQRDKAEFKTKKL
jgi:hypothetical protein